jgi:hypothetical protein
MNDGLYLSLSEQDYRAERRLSASGLCSLLVSPATFWARSWMNTDKQDDDTMARRLGRAYDVAILTPDQFEARYVRELDHADNALMTMTDIGEQLAALGEPKKKAGESVLASAQRLRAAGYEGPIKHLDEDAWEGERADRDPLPGVLFDRVVDEAERVHQDPDISKLMSGGASQVSVLWTDAAGMKWKARFDYLAPGFVTDLKTFSNAHGKALDQCIADAVRYSRYYVQAMLYWRAGEMVRKGEIEGQDAGADKLIERVMAGPPMEWWWVFRETGGVPNVLARQFRMTSDAHPHHLYQAPDPHSDAEYLRKLERPSGLAKKADAEIKMAVSLYRQAMEVWGEAEPWGAMVPVGEIGDDDFNPRWLEE